MFYRLGLKLRQFVSRATDLGIDFRKLVCDDNNSGFELAYTNEVTIDGKRSPRGRWLANELERSGSWLAGLSWARSGLGCYARATWVDLVRS